MAPPPPPRLPAALVDELVEQVIFQLLAFRFPDPAKPSLAAASTGPCRVPPPPPRLPAALMDDLVEEILLHIPPEDPARLLRAALVCKRWCRIVSDPGFRRRFREFHRTPPVLGLLSNRGHTFFVPTSSFRPRRATHRNYRAIDARHGRVLLHKVPKYVVDSPLDSAFVVWDPITGERRKLPLLPPASFCAHSWNAAVLCASPVACDHLDCHGGPFLVVLVGVDEWVMMFCYVYSSEAAAWSEEASAQHPGGEISAEIELRPGALVGNAVYFAFRYSNNTMKYDLGTREISLVCLPPTENNFGGYVLFTTEEGGLGFANLVRSELRLWSREAGTGNDDAGWAQSRVIELETFLPDEALSTSLDVAGFAYGVAVIFVRTDVGLFTIDLKSFRVTKVYEQHGWYSGIFPYMSFCTPALGAAFTEGT